MTMRRIPSTSNVRKVSSPRNAGVVRVPSQRAHQCAAPKSPPASNDTSKCTSADKCTSAVENSRTVHLHESGSAMRQWALSHKSCQSPTTQLAQSSVKAPDNTSGVPPAELNASISRLRTIADTTWRRIASVDTSVSTHHRAASLIALRSAEPKLPVPSVDSKPAAKTTRRRVSRSRSKSASPRRSAARASSHRESTERAKSSQGATSRRSASPLTKSSQGATSRRSASPLMAPAPPPARALPTSRSTTMLGQRHVAPGVPPRRGIPAPARRVAGVSSRAVAPPGQLAQTQIPGVSDGVVQSVRATAGLRVPRSSPRPKSGVSRVGALSLAQRTAESGKPYLPLHLVSSGPVRSRTVVDGTPKKSRTDSIGVQKKGWPSPHSPGARLRSRTEQPSTLSEDFMLSSIPPVPRYQVLSDTGSSRVQVHPFSQVLG